MERILQIGIILKMLVDTKCSVKNIQYLIKRETLCGKKATVFKCSTAAVFIFLPLSTKARSMRLTEIRNNTCRINESNRFLDGVTLISSFGQFISYYLLCHTIGSIRISQSIITSTLVTCTPTFIRAQHIKNLHKLQTMIRIDSNVSYLQLTIMFHIMSISSNHYNEYYDMLDTKSRTNTVVII